MEQMYYIAFMIATGFAGIWFVIRMTHAWTSMQNKQQTDTQLQVMINDGIFQRLNRLEKNAFPDVVKALENK